MQTLTSVIESITETTTNVPDPMHQIMDTAKRDQLIDAMEQHGWVGPPIVVLSEVQALTGAHRIAAAVKAGVDIPRVAVTDLCGAFGLDWAAIRDEHGDDWYAAAAELRELLPREVVDYLGYDVDGVA